MLRRTVRHAQGRLGIQLITGMAEADQRLVLWGWLPDPSRQTLQGSVSDLAPTLLGLDRFGLRFFLGWVEHHQHRGC